MDDLLFYTNDLGPSQKEHLLSVFSDKTTLAHRLLCMVLKGSDDKKEIMAALKISAAMLNKISTQAKQELLEELKKSAANPYDDIYFFKSLVLKGSFNPAQKLFLQLEKHFETRQKWQHLELLYIEGMRLCQATGNLKIAKQLAVKRKKNSQRLMNFIALSADLNNLLFEFEVYEQKKLPASFLRQTQAILEQAKRSGHYTLIHNALQLRYLFYSRYTNNYPEAKKLAEQLYRNRQRHHAQLDELTAVLALNVYANYLTIYEGQISSAFKKEVLQNIGIAGRHALFNFYYTLLDYYLLDNQFAELEALLKKIEHAEDNTKFTVYRYGILAVKSFAEKDLPAFKKFVGLFYENPDRLDFPEVECYLRILEAVKLMAEDKGEDALYKLNSLRVFIDRNLSERYVYERNTVSFLMRCIKGSVKESERQAFLKSLEKSPYRNIRFLVTLDACRKVIG